MYYKYKLPNDLTIQINSSYLKNAGLIEFKIYNVNWVTINNNRITIRKNYSWDGCSPKYRLINRITIGTWDGLKSNNHNDQQCKYPSLIHDVFYQFLNHPDNPLPRKEVDRIFYDLLRQEDFILKRIYYLAVRGFGKLKSNIRKYL